MSLRDKNSRATPRLFLSNTPMVSAKEPLSRLRGASWSGMLDEMYSQLHPDFMM
jgi:hypothetical protein